MRTAFCLLLLLLGMYQLVPAQDLSYTILGKDELGDTEIYSLLPTQNGRLYVSTNVGLFQYSYGEINPVPVKTGSKLTRPLFSLVEDQEQRVFGVSLKGEIYQVVGDSLEHYFSVPQRFASTIFTMCVDADNRLLLAADGILAIQDQQYEVLYDSTANQGCRIRQLPDGRIAVLLCSTWQMGLLHDQGIQRMGFRRKTTMRHPLLLNEQLFVFNNREGLNVNRAKRFAVQLSNSLSLQDQFQFNQREAWLIRNEGGMIRITEADGELHFSSLLLKDYFISGIAEAPDGTLYIGTFNQGILVVPNQLVKRYELPVSKQLLQQVEVGGNDHVFVFDKIHGVGVFTAGEFSFFNEYPKLGQDRLIYNPSLQNGPVSAFPGLYFQTVISGGSDKDIAVLSENSFVVAASIGVKIYSPDQQMDTTHWEKRFAAAHYYCFKGLQERCVSIASKPGSGSFFAATLSDVYRVTLPGKVEKITYQGRSIAANQLEVVDDKLWIATKEFGVLVWQEDSFTEFPGEASDLGHSNVWQMEFAKDRLFLSLKSGLYIANLHTGALTMLGLAEGLVSKHIKDFDVSDHNLWIVANNQLVSLALDSISEIPASYHLELKEVLVNGVRTNPTSTDFSYAENSIAFVPEYYGLLFEEETKLYYRLQGLDTSWQTTASITSLIDYKYLPPGSYTFQLKGVCRSVESPVLNYAFTIREAFWRTTWFMLIVVLCMAGFVLLLIYLRYRSNNLRNQEKLTRQTLKAEALSNELKALRTQMNPHFIFNSLNAIQDLVLENDAAVTYDYIEMFSSLIRKVLEFSERSIVSIRDETEFLKIYLQLSALRFEEGEFTYTFEGDVEAEQQIPSLLIQPFVENALVHGLFHKSGHKHLAIQLTIKDHLECVITDNGIGRKAAAEIRQRQQPMHESYALDAIQKRLDLLATSHQMAASYEFEDLFADEEAIGTRVIIRLPLLAAH